MKAQIEKILYEEYGVGIVAAPNNAVLWAAAKCQDPKKALKAANRTRTKYGAPMVYAPYGDICF